MIRVRQVKVDILNDYSDFFIKQIAKKLEVKSNDIINYYIRKKSIDARRKNQIFYVYEFDVELKYDLEKKVLNSKINSDIMKATSLEYKLEIAGTVKLKNKIVIVGSGPAGVMCAYILASAGYCPLIIEQGEEIDKRVLTVEEFFQTGKLNPLSNIQFGEGGAGTFSDGKLNTLVKDKQNRARKVFEIFVENGAPEEILYLANPHIGTDILRNVVKNMRNKIISMGGEFLFQTKLTDIIVEGGKLKAILVNDNKKILCDALVLAIGHSARDTFRMLNRRGLVMKNKNFAVGFRIIHPQDFINKAQYGKFWKELPPANYKLTHTCKNGRAVYSFCMCPGGYVVNASSEYSRLVVNGMSNYLRESEYANSAIVVSVSDKDYGTKLFSGLEYQEKLEEIAYQLGSGMIPLQLLKDFYNDVVSTSLGKVLPCIKGKYKFSNLNGLFSKEIVLSLKEGIKAFDKKIPGFYMDDALCLGVESRTSSPVVIVRDDNYLSNILGIYPCGEGAGYAGGITTAAMDGIKISEAIATKYIPKKIGVK